jgi:phenylacetate-CoA ligase
MNVDIEKRSAPIKGRFVSCTSGSTGVTLSFYKVYSQKIKEMAYYHSAWKKLGYKKYKLRMQFVGNQEPKGFVYELARNEIRVSIHEPFANILRDAAAYKIEFIQGYPSVVYEFALYCSQHLEDFEMSGLRKSLRAIFLNSEYPQPTYTDKIKEIFCVPYVVSYGHTEGCALAFDYGNGNYEVLQSYGYVETVKQDDGNHLVATSYDNYASPMIRYDTNDIVDSEVMHNGVLSSFCMTGGGRNGQFVKDINGVKIPLTGLISGRHHRLMTYCSQLQISQKEQGRATIYYVPLPDVQENLIPEDLFDARGVAIDFEFKKISEPIRTKSGKVLLLVK